MTKKKTATNVNENAEVEAADALDADGAAAEAGEADVSGADDAFGFEDIDMVVAERDDLKERLLRALAETENVRKRAERDRREAEAYGGVKLARDLLSVYDNLGRALGTIDDELRDKAKALVEGLELTQRDLLSAFARHKIEKIEPAPGDRFDPNRHQAMFEAPVPNQPAGSVIQVMTTGFVIGERLLRPAQVGVASGAPAVPKEDDGNSGEG